MEHPLVDAPSDCVRLVDVDLFFFSVMEEGEVEEENEEEEEMVSMVACCLGLVAAGELPSWSRFLRRIVAVILTRLFVINYPLLIEFIPCLKGSSNFNADNVQTELQADSIPLNQPVDVSFVRFTSHSVVSNGTVWLNRIIRTADFNATVTNV